MSRNESQKLTLGWAEAKQTSGEESIWAKFDYFKLRETLEVIVSAMEATAQQVEPLSEPEPDSPVRLVVSNDQPESAEDVAVVGPEKPAA